ncbi:MAG: alpha/beta fold hydrolase [Pseudobacteriovorax sp.]|nr:alpha/beta fold hydrolase [Pseudobacteriovorax sp.]
MKFINDSIHSLTRFCVIPLLPLTILSCESGMTMEIDHQCPKDIMNQFQVSSANYPFESRCYKHSAGILHYIDENSADGSAATVLAIHGNASWSMIYRKVAKEAKSLGVRFVAVDLIGFGRSSKPLRLEFDHTLESHSLVVRDFVNSLDLDNIVYLLHDSGGPIGLNVAALEAQKTREIMLLNTWAWPFEEIPEGDTSPFHALIDRGLQAHDPALETLFTQTFPGLTGPGWARRNHEEGTAEFEQLAKDGSAPFLDPKTGQLYRDDIAYPILQLAKQNLEAEEFLRDLNDNQLAVLRKMPVHLFFSDDTAFGPLKCDLGKLAPEGVERSLCPLALGLRCETSEPKTGQENCIDESGDL